MLPVWYFFLEKRQFSYVFIVVLILAGLYALYEIPKESAPAVVIPVGVVTTSLPGASAEDMETLVTNKLEDQISNISNIDTITSNSAAGLSIINVQFTANADIQQSIQDLRDAVSRAQADLPEETTTPQVMKVSFDDQPIMVISVQSDLPPTEFAKLGKQLSDDLKTIPGVSKVNVAGVPEREVSVIVRKEALELYGLRITDVIQAIAASNASLPAGAITMGAVKYDVNFKGSINEPAEIQDIAVTSKDGVPVYVRDIATVIDGLSPQKTYSRISLSGEPSNQAITLTIYKQTGGDVRDISAAIKQRLEELQAEPASPDRSQGGMLSGTTVIISPATDEGLQVGKQLGDLARTGGETVVLVILSLLIAIGWRESLVAALSIPLSFLIAFIALHMTGNTLNFISLFALILAVGILVDSGIVVTEAIHTRMRKFATPLEAARASLKDYAWPLIAGTMTTVMVFVPLFFISGIVGKFIAGIPYTLIFVLMASIFVALGIVPLIAILVAKREYSSLEESQEKYTQRITQWYKEKLRSLLESRRRQNIFLRSLAALFIGSIMLPFFGFVDTVFFPQADLDFVFINIKKPLGTTLANTDISTRAVEEILYEIPDIESFQTTVGQGSDFSGFSAVTTNTENAANITINLFENRSRSSSEIVADLERRLAAITDADVQVLQVNNGPPSGAPIEIRFTGDDLDALTKAAEKGRELLTSIPHVINVTTSTKDNGTEFTLTIDRAKASTLGLNAQVVAQTLRAAVNGVPATSIKKPGEDIDVMVRVNLNPAFTDASDAANASLESVKSLTIQGMNNSVLLGTILKESLAQSNAAIAHKDKKRVQTVTAYTDGNSTVSDITAEFQRRIAEAGLAPGITVVYGGEQENIDQSFTDMFFALIAGLALMFLVLVITFNSVRDTLNLLLIIPLSLIGVLDGLALTGQPVSFTSLMGVIALGGVIINHAIIIMDALIHHVKAEIERPLIDIVVDASATRLRPIFLTTITTVVGMIPLAMSDPTWGPLAYTVMFGLIFAICLTLVLTPVVFYRARLRDKK